MEYSPTNTLKINDSDSDKSIRTIKPTDLQSKTSSEESKSTEISSGDGNQVGMSLRQRNESDETMSRLNAVSEKLSLSNINQNFDDQGDESINQATRNESLFDVLPSFEMYHSLQSSSPGEYENPDDNDLPPDYFTYGDTSRPCTRTTSNFTEVLDDESLLTRDDDFSAGCTRAPTNVTPWLSNAASQSVLVPTTEPATPASTNVAPDAGAYVDQFENNLIDKSHTLPDYDSFDIEANVYITKDVPNPNEKPELESRLKEYTTGDIVHGYVVIENTSDKPIQFIMFYVTLEGYVSIVDNQNNKRILKRFLTMVDLSASWSYGNVSPSANLEFEPFSKDYEDCILGLRTDRILEPHSKYKKFFTFKFPQNLLDNSCQHEQKLHNSLPPTFGIDLLKKRGRNRDIRINSGMKYGYLTSVMSPILTEDLSQEKFCISYSVNAKVIGVTPTRPDRLVVLKEGEYPLRFIPHESSTILVSSKAELDSMCHDIEHDFEIADRVLKLNDSQFEEVENLDSSLKARQLTDSSAPYKYGFSSQIPMSSSIGTSKVENELVYIEAKSKSRRFLKMLKKNSKCQSENNKSGLFTLSADIPENALPYHSPVQDGDFHPSEMNILKSLNMKMKFNPSNSSKELSPPEIGSIKSSLIVMNVNSSTSVPINLSPDLFKFKIFDKLRAKFDQYHQTLLSLQEDFKKRSVDLDRYIGKVVFEDVKGMKNLKVDKIPIFQFGHSFNKEDWKRTTINQWESSIELNIDLKDSLWETLVPNFQTCLLSRLYCFNVEVRFQNGQLCDLMVPVRVQKFDD